MTVGYQGWHGCSDHLHMLIAICYEPVDGTLCCRFNTGEPVMFFEVPEEKYQILLRHKFAGSYFRKHIRGKYRCQEASGRVIEPVQFDPTAMRAKQEKQAAKRAREAPRVKTIEMSLFGEVIRGNQAKKRKN